MVGAGVSLAQDPVRRPRGAVVRGPAELDLATVPALEQRVDRALRRRPATVLVDLSGCGFADLYGCAALARLTARAADLDVDLRLCGLSPQLRRLVARTGVPGLRVDT